MVSGQQVFRFRALLFAAVVAATGGAGASASGDNAGGFFAALESYEAEDFVACMGTLEHLYTSGGQFPDGGELLLVECAAAAGDGRKALNYLSALVPEGRIDLIELKTKKRPGLEKLRADPAWSAFISALESSVGNANARLDMALRQELIEREAQDQKARATLAAGDTGSAALAEVMRVDADNVAWLKAVVAERGWPGKSLVGREAAKGAWVLVQHADADADFQRRALSLMEKAGPSEVDAADVALLTDRVLLAAGEKQRYGTQFKRRGKDLVLEPTEDMASLDARRAQAGLPPLETYKSMMLEANSEKHK